MTLRDCWRNVMLTALKMAWPHRSDDDRPTLTITVAIRGRRLYSRPMTLLDAMPSLQRIAERELG